jgi:hypothetical protein
MLYIICFLLLCVSTHGQTLLINVQSQLINSNTTYNISIDRSSSSVTMPNDGSITLSFPAGSYNSGQLGSVSCTPACTVNGTVLRLSSSSFTSSPKLIKITVSNVVNPPSTAAPADYTYQLLDNSNSTLESATTQIAGFSPGQFKCTIVE